MKKKLFKILSLFFVLLVFLTWFYVNDINHKKLKQIKSQLIVHPEMIPEKNFAKYTSFWYSNLRADIYWLESIQYIWWNVIGSDYKKYLFKMLDLITELNPFFEKPYVIWLMLLPSYNEAYENLDKKQLDQLNNQALELWLKWIKNFCDKNKLDLINSENNLNELWINEKYSSPCKWSEIPFNMWFLYYFYLKNPEKASIYYKIASLEKNAPSWAKILAAIMSWKWWDREKSIMMFLTLADRVNPKDNKKDEKIDENQLKCSVFSKELQKISANVFRWWLKINSDILKQIEDIRKKEFPFGTKEETNILNWDNCYNYINKSIREFNLHYLDEANKEYFKKFAENAVNAKELFDKKFIDYLPVDFQQYETHWIIYQFNNETWNFDYKMWDY